MFAMAVGVIVSPSIFRFLWAICQSVITDTASDFFTGTYAYQQRVEAGINQIKKDQEEIKKSQESWTLTDILAVVSFVIIVPIGAYVAYNYIMSLKQDKNLPPYRPSLCAFEQRALVYSK